MKSTTVIVLVSIALLVTAGCHCDRGAPPTSVAAAHPPAQDIETAVEALSKLVGDRSVAIDERTRAVQALAALRAPPAVAALHEGLASPPRALPGEIGLGSLDLELMVHLRIVEGLHRLGDDTQMPRIVTLVTEEPIGGELLHAVADATVSLGRTELIDGLIRFAAGGGKDESALLRALVVLRLLRLPYDPWGPRLSSIPTLSDVVTLAAGSRRSQLEQAVRLSQGRVLLSAGKTAELAAERADDEAQRSGRLVDLLEPGYGAYVEGDHVVVCTLAEIGSRWGAWWQAYGPRLVFMPPAPGAFVLSNDPGNAETITAPLVRRSGATHDAALALLRIASNPLEVEGRRGDALRAVGVLDDRSVIPELHALLNRPPPPPPSETRIHFGPGEEDERLVDLSIIQSLHALGDDSGLQQIGSLVATSHIAIEVADAILALGRVDLLEPLVRLADGPDEGARFQAMLVLNQLDLPEPPRGPSITSVPGLDERVTLDGGTHGAQLLQLVALSRGRVVLSTARAEELSNGKDDEAAQPRSGTLRGLLPSSSERYVENDRVVICTLAEMGARWAAWWRANEKKLSFKQAGQASFVLREQP